MTIPFPHNLEPTPENLKRHAEFMKSKGQPKQEPIEEEKWCEHNKNICGLYVRCEICNPMPEEKPIELEGILAKFDKEFIKGLYKDEGGGWAMYGNVTKRVKEIIQSTYLLGLKAGKEEAIMAVKTTQDTLDLDENYHCNNIIKEILEKLTPTDQEKG